MRQQQWRIGVGCCNFKCPVKCKMPFIIRKIKENSIGNGEVQMLLHEPGISLCPYCSIDRLNQKSCTIFFCKISCPIGVLVLPVMIGRCQGNFHLSNIEPFSDMMPL